MRVNIKPLSVNQAFQGRRFKTPAYKKYETDVLLMLRPLDIPEGKLTLFIEAGLSNKNADIDNIVKPFLDILQTAYCFNDRRIYKIIAEKIDVKKGCEYVEFTIKKGCK